MTFRRFFLPIRGPRLARRLVQLIVGLMLFGYGSGVIIQAGLGAAPWDVLHEGLARQFGLTVGLWSIVVSFVVLIGWLPLRERYGIGTLLNALIVGAMIDAAGLTVDAAQSWLAQSALLLVGLVAVGFATGLYIGAGFAPGPRDGLMTGIARQGPSIRAARTAIEVSVVVGGWLLGGTFGIGTLAFAFGIGPLVQYFLPRWTVLPDDHAGEPARA